MKHLFYTLSLLVSWVGDPFVVLSVMALSTGVWIGEDDYEYGDNNPIPI